MLNRYNNLPAKSSIVLIRPAINRWKLYKWYTPFASHEPSLGLLYIASYLKISGYQVKIIDGEVFGKKKLLKETFSLKPDIIGITLTTFSFSEGLDLATQFRKQLPESLIVMGGPHPSALPFDTLVRIPAVDGVVFGEGEETMLEVVQRHEISKIKGLAWRNEKNDIVVNQNREPINELDKYDIDWKLLEGYPYSYTPAFQSKTSLSVSLVVSRGCVYECSFCASAKILGKKIRMHSPEYVVKLMNDLNYMYGVKDFYFHDDYFPANREWMVKFCKELIKCRNPITWSCASRIEALNDDNLLLMKKSGCWQIGIGVESGSQKVLDRIIKRVSVRNLTEGLRRINSAGITIKGYFMLDTPEETFNDLFKTIKLIFKNNFKHLQFNYYAPLPGSRDYETDNLPSTKWEKMNLRHPLGYSKIPSGFFLMFEICLYILFYLKITYNNLINELFNNRSKLPT